MGRQPRGGPPAGQHNVATPGQPAAELRASLPAARTGSSVPRDREPMATGSSSAAPDSPPTPVSARRLPAPSFESLRDREFRLYWLGTALVFFDQGMANVALAWLMLELTESAA